MGSEHAIAQVVLVDLPDDFLYVLSDNGRRRDGIVWSARIDSELDFPRAERQKCRKSVVLDSHIALAEVEIVDFDGNVTATARLE